MAEFQKVSKVSDISVGEMKMVTVNGNDLALCNVDGNIYAIDNNCAHQGGPLSEGVMDGKIVTCPWHNWKFDVTTGDCTVNSMANVNCFKVKVEGDDVLVSVQMAALTPGTKAPSFELKGVDGKSYGTAKLKPGEKAVIAFFKATCPTCMLAMPFINKLFQHHQSDSNVKLFAVAQEDPAGAQGFIQNYNLSLPVALDQAPYPVSNQYGLTNVPTLFVVDSDGKVEQTTIGFVKKEYESLAKKLGDFVHQAAAPIFDGVTVPELKPG